MIHHYSLSLWCVKWHMGWGLPHPYSHTSTVCAQFIQGFGFRLNKEQECFLRDCFCNNRCIQYIQDLTLWTRVCITSCKTMAALAIVSTIQYNLHSIWCQQTRLGLDTTVHCTPYTVYRTVLYPIHYTLYPIQAHFHGAGCKFFILSLVADRWIDGQG